MLSYWIQSVLEPLWTRAPQWVGIPSPGDELTSNQHIRNSTIGKERSTSLKLPLFFPQLLLRFFLSTNSSCSCMHSTSLFFSLPSFMPFFLFSSIRLTAFVVKCFAQAKPYIYLDNQIIQAALTWLEFHQLPNGCFKNVGQLFHTFMKVGASAP